MSQASIIQNTFPYISLNCLFEIYTRYKFVVLNRPDAIQLENQDSLGIVNMVKLDKMTCKVNVNTLNIIRYSFIKITFKHYTMSVCKHLQVISRLLNRLSIISGSNFCESDTNFTMAHLNKT